MMRRGAWLATLLILAGCGPGKPATPLAHAIAALRAGDYNDFLQARAEAADAAKTAIQPGDDLCKITVNDMVKYSDVARIGRFDHPDLFKLSDDDRLVYALTVAGGHWVVDPGSFLANAPLVRAANGEGQNFASINTPGARPEASNNPCAKYDSSEIMANMAANADLGEASEDARTAILTAWISDLTQRYGSGFDDKMQSAVNHLEFSGYSAKWPPDSELIGGPKPLPTFKETQDSLSHNR
jgi:hypothetical protein